MLTGSAQIKCGSNNVMCPDFENITARILEEEVCYDVAIEAVKKIAVSEKFE